MCSTPKVTRIESPEIIKTAVKADASTQRARISNRANQRGIISENIKTSNNGINDEILSSKKKLLGE